MIEVSHLDWQFNDADAIRMITDINGKMVLRKQDDTNTVSLESGKIWERRKFNETHFTLEVFSLALTKNSAGDFVEGRDFDP